MNIESLKKAVGLAERLGHVFVATADPKGMPHVAAAGKLALTGKGKLSVKAWFCPGTMVNISLNPHISVVIWDADKDIGFQLLGKLEKVEESEVMDGYAPKVENKTTLPQVQRQLIISVEKVIGFKHAPHSDIEE